MLLQKSGAFQTNSRVDVGVVPKAGALAPVHLPNRAGKAFVTFPGIIDSMLAPYYNGRVKSIITPSSKLLGVSGYYRRMKVTPTENKKPSRPSERVCELVGEIYAARTTLPA